jgi:hypothetical protein
MLALPHSFWRGFQVFEFYSTLVFVSESRFLCYGHGPSSKCPGYRFFVAIGAIGRENLGQRERVVSLYDKQ